MISNARRNRECYKCITLNYLDFKDWKRFSEIQFSDSKNYLKNLRTSYFDDLNIKLKYGYFEESKVIECCVNLSHRSSRNTIKVVLLTE